MENKIREAAKPVFVTWILSVLCYLPMIAKGLTNSVDGLWASSFYQSGNIELGSGRWMLLFLDKFRGGYGAEPFSSLVALLFIVFAVYIAISMFEESRKVTSYIYTMLISCCVTMCCLLAYRFTSLNYCFGILTSVLAAWFLTKEVGEKKDIFMYTGASIALMVVSIGIYQVNLGCFFVLVILYMMKLIYSEENRKCSSLFIKTIVVFIVSCVLYKIAWTVCMLARHITASDYNGADSVSVFGIIAGLPHSLTLIYRSWISYFYFHRGITFLLQLGLL
ncbi:glucosyltransferase domain-containing protein [Pseudobutyrivibrio xylanivorans]|uniref:Uncharacterized protein n=1 Tax=Pseudobutyrivibrio xylanivorans TaxID=185007 RepID=A0A5P6VVC6_PSEXY|nr:glucosyltransferase domain-containing protein [Pseudobutyrivibrio xylanivorans]QFJ56318.1 hypothetical protein FXF36_15480 [Pseudobutyrivibrio xylanivorans]